MPDPIDIDALSALREAAGIHSDHHISLVQSRYADGYIGHDIVICTPSHPDDEPFAGPWEQDDWLDKVPERIGAYIVALVNAAPALIAELRDLRAENAALREVADAAEAMSTAWAMTELAMSDLNDQIVDYGKEHPTVAPMRAYYREQNADEHRKMDEMHAALVRLAEYDTKEVSDNAE